MSSWILFAVLGQLLTAITVFIDRYMLTQKKGIGSPLVYAFYVSFLSGFVLVLLPFGLVSIPSILIIAYALLAAASFIVALLLLYASLKQGTASDVMPVVTAFSALSSFFFAHLFLDEALPAMFSVAVILFIVGTMLISRFRFTPRIFSHIVLSGVLFGVSAFVIKLIFLETTFWDGFFWSRMANVIGAGFLLLWPGNASIILHGTKHTSHGTRLLVIGNKTLAGIAGVCIFLAISQGHVSVVNAMGGLQFAFLLGLAFLFSHRFPNVLRGEIYHDGRGHKIAGIVCIIMGLGALFIV